MSITLTVGATVLDLDPDLTWSDQRAWNPVRQTVERGLTGAVILHTGALLKGRPITLQNEENSGWATMTKTVVDQLDTWAAVPGLTGQLEYRGVTYDVVFRHGGEGSPAFEATPVTYYRDEQAYDYYLCIIRLMEI